MHRMSATGSMRGPGQKGQASHLGLGSERALVLRTAVQTELLVSAVHGLAMKFPVMYECNRAEITDILANWDQVLQVGSLIGIRSWHCELDSCCLMQSLDRVQAYTAARANETATQRFGLQLQLLAVRL